MEEEIIKFKKYCESDSEIIQYKEWIETNPNNLIDKLLKGNEDNKAIKEKLTGNTIISPSSSLELAEIYHEHLFLMNILKYSNLNLESKIVKKLIDLTEDNIYSFIELEEHEYKNKGNLKYCMQVVLGLAPYNMGLFNITNNMIDINFKQFNY